MLARLCEVLAPCERSRGARWRARLRPIGRPLELVLRPARDAPLHAPAPPRQVPALRGPDVGLLRPGLRDLLARSDRAALVRGRAGPDAAGPADHGGGRRGLLETALGPPLP